MTNSKSTKKALLCSVMALILCFSMLLGTTLAWFTDSVTSEGNIIKSGKLEVSMDWAKGTEDPASADWLDASEGAIFNNNLWEPGYTEARHIKVTNDGTLALKYQMSIIANGEVSILADVIDVYVIDGGAQVTDRDVESIAGAEHVGTLADFIKKMPAATAGNLEAGASKTITIVLKMQETAGNEYQNKSIGTNFSVQLLATQYTSESDSFNNQYDAEAGYKAIYTFDNASELIAFDPYNFNGNTAGTGLSIVDGKAVVNAIGAFFFRAVDLTQNIYTVEYDVDATALSDGEMIQLDTGDTASWSANTPLTITNTEVTIAGDTVVTQKISGALHVVHTYALNADNKWVTTTTVTNGTDSVSNTKVQQPSYPGTGNNVYWDIIGLSDTAVGKVTLDNFEFYANVIPLATVTVTPDTIGSMTFDANNTQYVFSGSFDAIDIVAAQGLTQVFDGTDATVSGRISLSYPGGVAHSHDNVKKGTERSGSYTLQNFTAESIHAATYNTSVTISGNHVEFLEVDSANIAMNITGNVIDSNNESHTVFQKTGTNKYGVYLSVMNYDLSFDGNTVKNTLSHSVGINGRQSDIAAGLTASEVTNKITSFSNNNITISNAEENRAALKIWDDTVYAPTTAQNVLSDGAKEVIALVLASNNTMTKTQNAGFYFNFYSVLTDSLT